MTIVYRAWSPSQGSAGPRVDTDRDAMIGVVSTLNQGALTLGTVADWVLQSGEIEWRTQT